MFDTEPNLLFGLGAALGHMFLSSAPRGGTQSLFPLTPHAAPEPCLDQTGDPVPFDIEVSAPAKFFFFFNFGRTFLHKLKS